MKLEGNLGLFSLRELIEMSVYSSVLGVLKLKGPQQTGHIFFREGVAYHCVYGDLVGEAGLVALFQEQDASFMFEADAISEEATLWSEIHTLIERCEALAARWRKVRAALPAVPVAPYLISNPGVTSMSIESAHFAMLAGIDGERTLEQIAELLSLEPLDVYEAAVRLRRDGLLDLRPVESVSLVSKPAARVLSSTAPSQASSVIDRILTSLHTVGKPSVGLPAVDKKPAPGYTPPPPPPSVDDDPILRLIRG